MKTLEFEKMEKLVGEGGRDCLVRGVGIGITAIAGIFFFPFWGATAAIAFTSGDCFY